MASLPSRAHYGFVAVAVGIAGALLYAAVKQDLGSAPARGPEAQATSPSSRYPNPWPAPPAADVVALLDGLMPGAELPQGFVVRAISPVHERRIVIDVERGDLGFRVWVVRRGSDGRRPPGSSEHYAVYFVQPRPQADSIDDEARRGVLSEILRRLRKTETSARVPSGL